MDNDFLFDWHKSNLHLVSRIMAGKVKIPGKQLPSVMYWLLEPLMGNVRTTQKTRMILKKNVLRNGLNFLADAQDCHLVLESSLVARLDFNSFSRAYFIVKKYYRQKRKASLLSSSLSTFLNHHRMRNVSPLFISDLLKYASNRSQYIKSAPVSMIHVLNPVKPAYIRVVVNALYDNHRMCRNLAIHSIDEWTKPARIREIDTKGLGLILDAVCHAKKASRKYEKLSWGQLISRIRLELSQRKIA